MPRTRYVWPTHELPHKWAHQTQESGRNPQGNLSFDGPTIRSYSTPVARLYPKKGAESLVLISERRYSMTTARQLGMIAQATRHLTRIYVPVPCFDKSGNMNWRNSSERTVAACHAANLKFLLDRMNGNFAAAGRRMSERAVEWDRNAARGRHADFAAYVAHFGIRRKVPALPDFGPALERARRIETPDPVRDAAKIRARERKEARKVAAAFVAVNCARSSWRMGGSLPYVRYSYRNRNRAENPAVPVMLRIAEDQIETSQGARIPVADAPRLWQLVESARARGGIEFNGLHAPKAGDYQINQVEPDGTLRVGCHVIPHSELRSMARALHLI